MRYWRLLALLPLIALGTPPASAEMFGADYKPCGDKQSTVDIVACVTAAECMRSVTRDRALELELELELEKAMKLGD
jgi:hypothetical protein